jgi:outer membrane protease
VICCDGDGGRSRWRPGLQADVIARPRSGISPFRSAATSFGLLNGEAKDTVYDYETADGSRRQQSRLDWNGKTRHGGVQFSSAIKREDWTR